MYCCSCEFLTCEKVGWGSRGVLREVLVDNGHHKNVVLEWAAPLKGGVNRDCSENAGRGRAARRERGRVLGVIERGGMRCVQHAPSPLPEKGLVEGIGLFFSVFVSSIGGNTTQRIQGKREAR